MNCPACGSNDIFDSELGGDAALRCNSCFAWFDREEGELMTDVVTLHQEARNVRENVGAGDMPFMVNPAMLSERAQKRREEEGVREADQQAWESVRDDILAVVVVNGENLPNFQVASATCENGCHTWVGVADVANDIGYTTPYTSMPTFLAQMQGIVDFNGNVNPTVERSLILAYQSALN